MTMSSAAATKILSASENFGGSGGGSFSPTRIGGPVAVDARSLSAQ